MLTRTEYEEMSACGSPERWWACAEVQVCSLLAFYTTHSGWHRPTRPRRTTCLLCDQLGAPCVGAPNDVHTCTLPP
jgi:hypothetical protein